MKKLVLILIVISALLIPIGNTKKQKTVIKEHSVKCAKIPDNIKIQPEDSAGYELAIHFAFTQNIDKQKAVSKLKSYMLFKDGQPCKEDYELVVNFREKDKTIFLSVTYPNGINKNISTGYKIIESQYAKYACVTPYEFFRYAIIIDRDTITSDIDVNQIAVEALNNSYLKIKQQPNFDLTYEDSLDTKNDIWSESYVTDMKDYNYKVTANVRIVDNVYTSAKEELSKNPLEEVILPPEDEKQEESDKVDELLDKLKENKVLKYSVTSVLGIALVYVGFVILRKIWRILKR